MFIPGAVNEISVDWLSQVLDTQVAAFRVVDAHAGTTGRAVLAIDYVGEAKQPNRLFVKLPPDDETQRAFVTSSGMGRREALFYQQLSAELSIRVPHCYHAACDESGERYIMLLEQLQDSRCTFKNASTNYSLSYIRAVLKSFAKLHAAYWESSRFVADLSWLQPPVQHPIGVQLVARALDTYGGEMPAIFKEMAELYTAETDAIHRLWNGGASTLIHGDVHDGNLFFDGDEPGFLDWALVARGPCMRDVGYFIAGTMPPDERECHQREMLSYYRNELQACGTQAPPIDDLWRQYQWHAVYVWVGATTTLAMGEEWQPISYTRKTLDRLNRALEDLDSVAAIRAGIGGAGRFT